MDVVEITEADEFGSMATEWNALVDRCANPVVFSRHEWLWAWWQTYGGDRPLHIVCLRNRDNLIAVFPLLVDQFRLKKIVNCRVALPMGQGQASYQDVVVARGFESASIGTFLRHLRENHADWDALILRKLDVQSVWLSLAGRGMLGPGTRVWREPWPSPYIRLPTRMTDLEEGWPGALRNGIRRSLRKLQRAGRVDVIRFREVSEILAEWPSFLEMHETRWGLGNLLEAGYDRYKEFAHRLIEAGAPPGLVSLWVLRLNGSPIAYELCLDYGRVRHSFMRARVTDYGNVAVGNISAYHVIADAVTHGFERYELGGGLHEYKYGFAAYDHQPRGLAVPLTGRLKGRLTAWLESWEGSRSHA